MTMDRQEQAEFILSRLEGHLSECESARSAARDAFHGNHATVREASTRNGRLEVIEQALADIEQASPSAGSVLH